MARTGGGGWTSRAPAAARRCRRPGPGTRWRQSRGRAGPACPVLIGAAAAGPARPRPGRPLSR